MTKRRSEAAKADVRPSAPFASKIIKAGALLADTKTLLAHWDTSLAAAENLRQLQRENVFGKASRSRVADILGIFRQRYASEESVTKALVRLVHGQIPAVALDAILYFHAARADRLLSAVVTEILVPQKDRGLVDVDVNEVHRTLATWVKEGKTSSPWSDETTRRVTQGVLATLRDFGVLQGSVNKRIAAAYLPVAAFSYIAFYLKQHQPSGEKLLQQPDWKLFFLNRDGVERFLFEANQHGLLEYHAAGTVTRLTFPADALEEYANVLVERAH